MTWLFLLTDQVGTLRAVADTSGNIVKRIDYDSFGNIISDSNTAMTIPFGFAGGLHDRDTGLVRFGYRDYSPELGRFVAKDPIDFAGGDTNLYGYATNDPVNFTDPLGLDPQVPPEEGGHFWDVNPVTRCHVNPKRDPCENLTEGLIIAGGLAALACPNPWLGKIAKHGPHGTHPYDHIQIMLRTGANTTKHWRIPLP